MEKRGIPFEAQKRVYTKSGRRYLVDFLIPPKLVVEVGYISAEDMQEDQDLRDSGYTVLRYRNKEITRGVGVVCLEIEGERRRLSQQQGQRP
jgi:very-short-patch-repair endonuclease